MRKQNTHNVTGIIKTDKENIAFSGEDFKFVFMKTDLLGDEVVLKADESGYIWGTTHGEVTIGIYSGTDINIKSTHILNTWNYIVSKNWLPLEHMWFDGIRFENGCIKDIYPCNALHEIRDKEPPNLFTYEMDKDSRIFEFASNEYVTKWKFYSLVTQKKSVTEGDSISNSNSILDIEFSKPQPFSSLLNYYNQVCDLCSFLTFRNSVSFEKISLFKKIKRDQEKINVAFAECHMKEPDVISHRKWLNIIQVRSLEETVFENILKNMAKTDKKHKGLPLLIIPKDDMDAHTIDIGKIRHICSALEMELDLEGVRLEKSPEIADLIEMVKKMVQEYKEEQDKLRGDQESQEKSNKMYDSIFGSIAHWDQPLANRVCKAWDQHISELEPFLKRYDIPITHENIGGFVKARNNITHNGSTGVSDEVANTAFALMGLIYCCALTRLGVDSKAITDIMTRGIIG